MNSMTTLDEGVSASVPVTVTGKVTVVPGAIVSGTRLAVVVIGTATHVVQGSAATDTAFVEPEIARVGWSGTVPTFCTVT
jgi:hypothetical protein